MSDAPARTAAEPALEAPASPEEVVRLEDVSVRYRIPRRQRLKSLREYLIRRFQFRKPEAEVPWALRGLTVSFRRGESVALVGRNGAGKSTLLRVIARVLQPASGRVRVDGRVVPLLGMAPGFHPELTGRENIQLAATLLGRTAEEIRDAFDGIAAFAELEDSLDVPLRGYSAGMVARLGAATALAWWPEILLLDEALASTDIGFQRKVAARLEDFKRRGTTLVAVSHLRDPVIALCERAVWIERGVARRDGPLNEVMDAYEGSPGPGEGRGALCFVNSLPKAGTHLLEKAVARLGYIEGGEPLTSRLQETLGADPDGILVGVGHPRRVPRRAFLRWLDRFPPGTYVKSHLPHSDEAAAILRERGIRMVTIVRDPRDVVVSHVEHVMREGDARLREHFLGLTPERRLLASISGVGDAGTKGPDLLGIGERLGRVLAWRKEPENLLIRFERLVGPEGGGSEAEQLDELRAVAAHLRAECSDAQLRRWAGELFGGTATFRKGRVGGWKDVFTEEHKGAFKRAAGPLLIELGYERDLDW